MAKFPEPPPPGLVPSCAEGGVLGVLFGIVVRRTLVVEADLPFPESVAASEIVKAGQGGQSGAGTVFGSMGNAWPSTCSTAFTKPASFARPRMLM